MSERQSQIIDDLNETVVGVIKTATTYEEFINQMKDRGYESHANGFNKMNNFHQYFEKEGPFWSSFLQMKVINNYQHVVEVTRDNLHIVVIELQESGVMEEDEGDDKLLLALKVVEEQKAAHPKLRDVSWEECYERAMKRETVVADLMFDCMKILIKDHGFEYSKDIEG